MGQYVTGLLIKLCDIEKLYMYLVIYLTAWIARPRLSLQLTQLIGEMNWYNQIDKNIVGWI